MKFLLFTILICSYSTLFANLLVPSVSRADFYRSKQETSTDNYFWNDQSFTGLYAVNYPEKLPKHPMFPTYDWTIRYAIHGNDQSFIAKFMDDRITNIWINDTTRKSYLDAADIASIHFNVNDGSVEEFRYRAARNFSFEDDSLSKTLQLYYGVTELTFDYDNSYNALTGITAWLNVGNGSGIGKTYITIDSAESVITSYKHIAPDGTEINFDQQAIEQILADPEVDHKEVIRVINALLGSEKGLAFPSDEKPQP